MRHLSPRRLRLLQFLSCTHTHTHTHTHSSILYTPSHAPALPNGQMFTHTGFSKLSLYCESEGGRQIWQILGLWKPIRPV
jgi:hypothetical protein